MGYTNGNLSSKSKNGDKGLKGEKGDRGDSFKLTPEKNFHLQNKRLTNLSAPKDDHDATTKKFVADLLKAKAGTTYVNNELSKKANSSTLKNYVFKSDVPSNDALEDYALKTDLQNLASEVSDALKDKIDYSDLANYSTTSVINNSLSAFADKSYIDNSLTLKVNLSDFNTYSDNINNQMSSKVNNSDLADYYTKMQVDNNFKTKQYLTIWAERNGPLTAHKLDWSFSNGTEYNRRYGWPTPVDGKIVRPSICVCAGNQMPAEVKVSLLLNGEDISHSEIVKPDDAWTNHTIFSNPVSIKAGDRITFRSETSNSSVTHAIVSLLIEIDI